MIAENSEAVVELIEEARVGNAHEALGYASWTKYVAEKFGGSLARLDKVSRKPFVELMADQGMSTRAIASIVGVSKDTVSRDLRAGVSDEPPERRVANVAGKLDPERQPPSAKVLSIREGHRTVTGTDGKTYNKPEPQPVRRRPFPDAYREASWKVLKAVESLNRLHQDGRFASNREAITRNEADLARAADILSALLEDLSKHAGGRCRGPSSRASFHPDNEEN